METLQSETDTIGRLGNMTSDQAYHMLVFYVPATHVEQVKAAVFAAGAGQLGAYDRCCWQVQGKGQFRPLKGSHPHIGETLVTESVDEIRVEMICGADCIGEVVAAFVNAHPYETPAYAHWNVAL